MCYTPLQLPCVMKEENIGYWLPSPSLRVFKKAVSRTWNECTVHTGQTCVSKYRVVFLLYLYSSRAVKLFSSHAAHGGFQQGNSSKAALLYPSTNEHLHREILGISFVACGSFKLAGIAMQSTDGVALLSSSFPPLLGFGGVVSFPSRWDVVAHCDDSTHGPARLRFVWNKVWMPTALVQKTGGSRTKKPAPKAEQVECILRSIISIPYI